MADLESVKKRLVEAHDTAAKAAQRWGFTEDKTDYAGGCYASMSVNHHSAPYMYLVFHGDGADLTFDELVDYEKQTLKIGNSGKAWGVFEGTDRSLRWVKYLLSPASPWRELQQYMEAPDAAEINKSGWIFKDLQKIPTKLFYNFAMAQRMAWENAPCYSTWLKLCDTGMDATLALFIANNFALTPEAKDLTGPWEVFYPWSYLEGGGLDCAYHFIKGKPKELTAGSTNTPNVFTLWQCDNPQPWIVKTNELCTRINLSLDEIVEIVNDAVTKQEQACAG